MNARGPGVEGAQDRGSFSWGDESGYNLITVVIAITLLNVALAVVLPVWSHAIQREKEEELIFRGIQYAEAVRVFQKRTGRLPIRLEELMEVKPRSLRKLWKDPMTEDGKWGLVFQLSTGSGILGQPRNPQQQPRRPLPRQPGRGAPQPTTGPIQGVHSLSEEDSIKTFMGENRYNQWRFVVNMMQIPANPQPDAPLPRANPAWLLRPFRDGLQPKLGTPRGLDTNDVNRGGTRPDGGARPRIPDAGRNPTGGRRPVPPPLPRGQGRGGS